MKDVTLNLSVEEVNAILQVLGDLPSKTGAWPLIVKIKEQAEPQVSQDSNNPVAVEDSADVA